MSIEAFATLVTSLTALIGVGLMFLRLKRMEIPASKAETDKSNVETIGLLSGQLQDCLEMNQKLRTCLEDTHLLHEYTAYLLRGIGRLIAALNAQDIVIPWQPLSFDVFSDKVKNEETIR